MSVKKQNPENQLSTEGLNGHTSGSSLSKIEANRSNALRSTGPKTERGKRTSSLNAVKHGILSRGLIIRDRDGQESQADYDELLTQLRESLQPMGALEEIWTEKIAVICWKLARVTRCETADIERALCAYRHKLKNPEQYADPMLEVPSNPELETMSGHLSLPSGHLSLPTDQAAERILRYDAALNRQLNHAVTQLERLQRGRRGEPVPPPISIEVEGEIAKRSQ